MPLPVTLVAKHIPMRRELKDQVGEADVVQGLEVAKHIPMRRELKVYNYRPATVRMSRVAKHIPMRRELKVPSTTLDDVYIHQSQSTSR